MAQNLLSYFSKGARNSKKSTSTPRRQRSLLSYHARNIEGVFSVVCWLAQLDNFIRISSFSQKFLSNQLSAQRPSKNIQNSTKFLFVELWKHLRQRDLG